MRVEQHPILKFSHGGMIKFYFNGIEMYGFEGDTIATALYANGIKVFGHSAKKKRPRGFFCGIGKCSSCMMRVNGVPNIRTCITPLQEGMIVESDKYDLPETAPYRKPERKTMDVDIAIVGGGPAGMAAAIEAGKHGDVSVLIIDEQPRLGGQLIKQTHKFFGSSMEGAGKRGIEIASEMEEEARKYADILLETSVIGYYNRGHHFLAAVNKLKGIVYEIKAKKIIFATGAQENYLVFENNDLPGVYGAGGIQTIMNVYGVKPGKAGIIVGAGNVGLILAYQLLQAGVKVKAIVEAMPRIGGYFVHAAKVRRHGVPIYTKHSIMEAIGKESVEGAIIAQLDEKWNFVPGTEKKIDCDFIAIAIGLTPSARLAQMAGAKVKFIREAGGWVALHNEFMETTANGIYIAGDAANIEEASAAMVEGKIAAVHALNSISPLTNFEAIVEELRNEISSLRKGKFGEKARLAKERIYGGYYEELRGNRSG